MSNISNNVIDSGLTYVGNYDTLYFLDADVGLDSSLISAHTIVTSYSFSALGLSDYPGGGRRYGITASGTPATASKAGTITHYALCEGSGDILMSGQLTNPITVAQGDKVTVPDFYAIFQDPA